MPGTSAVERLMYERRSSMRGEDRMLFSLSRATTKRLRKAGDLMSSLLIAAGEEAGGAKKRFWWLMAAMRALSCWFCSGPSLVSV